MGEVPVLQVIGKRIDEWPFPFHLQRSSLCAARGRLMNLKRGIFRLLMVGSAFWTIGLTILTYNERKSMTNSLPPSPTGYILDPKFCEPFLWAQKEFGLATDLVLLLIIA
jgi:hypothetical protein